MADRLSKQIVVRCSPELKKEIEKWAARNHTKPGEMTRKLLEIAVGLQEPRWQFPPGIKAAEPPPSPSRRSHEAK